MMDFSAVNVQNTRLDCFRKTASSHKKPAMQESGMKNDFDF